MKKYIILAVCLILLLFNESNCSCFRAKQLTTQSTQHSKEVNILKMTSDSKTVFSVGYDGDIKIWELLGNSLYLKQSWSLNEKFPDYAINALYVWRDGLKLFVGGSSRVVKIYTYIPQTQLYDLVNFKTVNTRATTSQDFQWIASIYVNNLGNQMFIGVDMYGDGISRFVYNGQQWIKNNPSSIMKQIGTDLYDHRYINFIDMTKDQTKLIFVSYDYSGKTLLIFNSDGENYSLNQKIMISDYSSTTCRLSEDDSIISCFGYYLQFGNYRLDKTLNQYVNVSAPNTMSPVKFPDAFMDSNNYLTVTSWQDSTIYRYKFQYLNGTASYTEVDKVSLLSFSTLPKTIVSQPESKFHLVGTWLNKTNTNGGKIFMVSCYQLNQEIITQ